MNLHDQFNSPLLRQWDLDENSTHYEKQVAAPSNEDMVTMWTTWYIIFYILAICTTSVFIALVCTRKVRQSSFNLFLIYLMVPDCLVLWLCATSCLVNSLAGYFTSVQHCKFQSFYLLATLSSNAWLNLAITRHLLTMLQSAAQFKKYKPPSRKRVTIEALGAYAFSIFLACWFLVDAEWWPFRTRLNSGIVCLPQDFSYVSTAFYYSIFLPLGFLIPLGYVFYAVFVIWRQNLLPTSGGRRALAIYFFRLVFAFAIMWVPCLVLLIVTSAWTGPWIQWAGGLWGHLQGVVSGAVSLCKPDIWAAYKDFYKPIWGCFCTATEEEDADRREPDGFEPTTFSRQTRFISGSFSAVYSRASSIRRSSRISDIVKDLKDMRKQFSGFSRAESELDDIVESDADLEISVSGGTKLQGTAATVEVEEDTSDQESGLELGSLKNSQEACPLSVEEAHDAEVAPMDTRNPSIVEINYPSEEEKTEITP